MAACDLRVVVDKADRIFGVGELVTGHVEVRVRSSCACKRLTLSWGWRTHGKGNVTSGRGGEVELFQGQWIGGQEASYKFAIETPHGPLTYHGTLLSVDWYLLAKADVSWASHPKAETEILVVPGLKGGSINLGPKYRAPVMAAAADSVGRAGAKVLGGGALVLAGVGVASASAALSGLAALIPLAIGGWFAFLGGRIALSALRNPVAERKLGRVVTSITPDRVRPGDGVVCHVAFTPRHAAELKGMTATIMAREVVISGSGTNQSTHRHVVYQESVVVQSTQRPARGDPLHLEGRWSVPAEAPFTFVADSNELGWTVRIDIELAGWIRWSREMPITVSP